MGRIDINCDLGESYGIYEIGNDKDLFPHITSANIACGFHAGDYNVMAKTISAAMEHNVALGAHPGYPDLAGFGRRYIEMDEKEIYRMVLYQIAAFQGVAKALGGRMQHVKPHGALYNMAATNQTIATAISEAVYDCAPDSIVFGLANSLLTKTAERLGLKVANEIFADRSYRSDGTLVPRTEKHAVIIDAQSAVAQCTAMVLEQKSMADTICIHGDHPNAIAIAKALDTSIVQAGMKVQAIGKWKE